ncbi:MAG TPA: MaoC family dehydratase [Anaeromyxobacteraceae bacterium]|nr:MaoC family dehydratase [Anaeromyxobacteraceae bacterium]
MKSLTDFRVGDTFVEVRVCDRYRPVYYAAVSGDFNPIHIDAEAARRAGHDGAILHGLCTFSWFAEACVRYFDGAGRLAKLEARFARPVAVGDTLRFEGRCERVEAGRVRVAVTVSNQRGEEVLLKAAAEAVVEGGRP